jgi:hypothetical protein
MVGHGGVVVAFILAPFGGSGVIHSHVRPKFKQNLPPPILSGLSQTGRALFYNLPILPKGQTIDYKALESGEAEADYGRRGVPSEPRWEASCRKAMNYPCLLATGNNAQYSQNVK